MTKQVCNHSIINHFFYNILCPHQTLIKRVVNIAAAPLLLLGAAFVVYSDFFKNRTVTIPENTNYGLPTDQLGQNALEFARNSLQAHPKTKPCNFGQPRLPVNPAIPLLTTLFFEVHYPALKRALQRNKRDTWNQQEVLQAANRCMKVSYAISRLTLEDLPELALKEPQSTPAQVLIGQDSHAYRTYFYCTQIYHNIRAGAQWDQNAKDMVKPENIPESHAAPFYQAGTLQNSWNRLYNDFYDRVVQIVSAQVITDPDKYDERFGLWIQKDTGVNTFRATPTALPT